MLSWFKSRPAVLPIHSPRERSEDGYDDVQLSSSTRQSFAPSTTTLTNGQSSYPPKSQIAVTNGYPSLRSTFRRLERALTPVLYDSLAPPARPNAPELVALLHAISPYYLPAAVLDAYLCHDGQDPFAVPSTGLVYGLRWLTLDQVLQEWLIWRKFEAAGGPAGITDAFSVSLIDDPSLSTPTKARQSRIHPYTTEDESEQGMSSFPPGWVRPKYSHPGWIPLLSDAAGNYIGVDLDPPPSTSASSTATSTATSTSTATGQSGQVIAFGREMDEKVVLFPGDSAGGWGRFLASFVDDVTKGDFATLGESNARSGSRDEGEEDDEDDGIGQQSYFESDRYGQDGEDGEAAAATWTLRSEWRHWASEHAGGVIAALAERSKRQWQSVGVGLSPAPERNLRSPFRAPLSIDVPLVPEAGPSSAVTVKGSGSSQSSLKSPPFTSTSSKRRSTSSTSTSRNDLTPTRNGTNSVEWTLSPASPSKRSTTGKSPRSPHFLAASSPRQAPGLNGNAKRKRGPPPPPAQLDLPTSFDFDSGARAAARLSEAPYAYEQRIDIAHSPEDDYPARFPSSSSVPTSTTVNSAMMSSSTPSQSTTALVSHVEDDISNLNLQEDRDYADGIARLRTPPPPLSTAAARTDNDQRYDDRDRPDLIRLRTGSSSDSSQGPPSTSA